MKILKNYKNLVSELFEVDDTKIIKYKDKDGESKEMPAKSAKTMPDEHPAKQAWDKESDKEDGGEEEKPSGQKLSGSDFDRDGGDDDFKKIPISDPDDEDSEVGKYLKSKGDKDDSDGDRDIDRSKSYDGKVDDEPKEEEPTFRTLKSQFKSDELEKVSFDRNASEEAREMEMEIADELLAHYSKGGEDEEMFDVVTGESERLVSIYQKNLRKPSKRNLKDYRDELIKNIENRRAQNQGKPIVHKGEKTSDKKSPGTMGSVGVREPGQAGSGMYDSVQPKNKPFLKEQLERIGGGKY